MSKVAFVFPGQGTQYVGMGEKLYESVNNETKGLIDNIYNIYSNFFIDCTIVIKTFGI